MGKYPVTQGQWVSVMGTTLEQQGEKEGDFSMTRDLYGLGTNHPMYYVSWEEANDYIRRLNDKNDGFQYSLPSEAQWKYAAKARTTGDRYGPLDYIAWNGMDTYIDVLNSDERVIENEGQMQPVGLKFPNDFGLYDMLGNIWEWCEDIFNEEGYNGLPTDGSANTSIGNSSHRVLRGGSWADSAAWIGCGFRMSDFPSTRTIAYGFRVIALPIVDANFDKNTYVKLKPHLESAFADFANEPDHLAQTRAFIAKLNERFTLDQIGKLKPFVVAFLEEQESRKHS